MDENYDKKLQMRIRQEFTRLKDESYLDHAAATLYSETQIKDITSDLCKNIYGNPHSLSQCSKNASDLIDQVRFRILNHFHTSQDDYSIIFTSGATGAIKLLLENFDWSGNEETKADDEEETFFDGSCNHEGDCDQNTARKSAYVYTQSNHTSVVGGRELASEKNVQTFCVGHEEVFSIMENAKTAASCRYAVNSLFAYPAQCSFSGYKYPLSWVKGVKNGALQEFSGAKWFVLLDAATLCSTSDLDLSRFHPDFVCLSFYKIFGYPTGLGALLVRNESAHTLVKTYFGGGTVDISLTKTKFHKLRSVLHERFEDGTIDFLSIISLSQGFNTLQRLGLTMPLISQHVFQLARSCFLELESLRHWNDVPAVELYADTDYEDSKTQGGIVNFNLKRPNGEYIGYIEVLHMANLHKIYFRTGCFCNTGACQRHLRLTDEDLMKHFQAGHVCGDERDIVHGKPTGSIRVSFGYMSTMRDVERLLNMVNECFVETKAPRWAPGIDGNLIQDQKLVELQKIYIYPVKSCGAVEVTEWQLSERGLQFDREWMVVTEDGVCLSQKQEPRLCLVLPRLDLQRRTLALTFKTSDDHVTIPIDLPSEPLTTSICGSKVCGDQIQARDCGDDVAWWLSRHLGRRGLRLVRQGDEDGRTAKHKGDGRLSLSNQAQFLLVNQRSVEWLLARIDDGGFQSETFPDRFRGNFVINTRDEFSETTWSRLVIGNIEFKVDGPCTRCQMICIDQHTGEKNRQPLVALSRALNGKLRFGIYLSRMTSENQIIKVTDSVQTCEAIKT